MRFKDYLKRLNQEDKDLVLKNLEEEEMKLRDYLKKFDSDELIAIAIMMNDTFMLALNLTDVDFIVELYKCQKADFLYENVDQLIEDIEAFAYEEFD